MCSHGTINIHNQFVLGVLQCPLVKHLSFLLSMKFVWLLDCCRVHEPALDASCENQELLFYAIMNVANGIEFTPKIKIMYSPVDRIARAPSCLIQKSLFMQRMQSFTPPRPMQPLSAGCTTIRFSPAISQ
jgi:hypothetical protein